MDIITKTSNTPISINASPLKTALKLKKEAINCLLRAGIIKDLDFKSLDFSNIGNKILNVLLEIETSETFEAALLECLKSCILDLDGIKHKITFELFDEHPELREDYYQIILNCLEVNLRPFLNSLVSEFKTRLKTMKIDSQE